nr:hypothetical protein [uncultured Cohaesibacter sp.]
MPDTGKSQQADDWMDSLQRGDIILFADPAQDKKNGDKIAYP